MEDEVLKALILKMFADKEKRHGYNCVAQGLAKNGIKVCKHCVAKLMNEMSLKARACKKSILTTDSNHEKAIADLIDQSFTADRPDENYVSNITYVRTREGRLYLCVVLDLFSKMFVGWSFSRRMKAGLVVNAINMTAGKDRGLKSCIFRSDRGSQYWSEEIIKALRHYGMRQSIGRTGCCYDNVFAESFFYTLKVEETFGKPFKSISETSLYIFEFIKVFYNRTRMHSGLSYFSPAEFEQLSNNEDV